MNSHLDMLLQFRNKQNKYVNYSGYNVFNGSIKAALEKYMFKYKDICFKAEITVINESYNIYEKGNIF